MLNLKKLGGVTGLYLLFSCLFFFPIFQGRALIYSDNLLERAPAYHLWKEALLQGRLPLWNPYIFAGMPFLADPSHAVFSPFNLILLLFKNVLSAVTFQVILLVFLAALGAYFLAGSLKLNIRAAFLVGLIFGFSGSVMEAANDVNSLTGIVLIPWVLLVLVKDTFDSHQFFSWKLAFVLAVQLLSGHTQYAYYTLIILMVSYIYLLISKFALTPDYFKKIIGSLMTLALSFGLAAIQLLPTWELINQSQRVGGINLVNSTRLEMTELPRLFFPKIFGAMVEGNSWGPGSLFERGLANVYGYSSLVALLMAGWVTIKFWQNKLVRILTSISLLTLVLSWGNQTSLFTFFSHWLPGFGLFRSPYRILIIYSLAVSLLAGIGFNHLSQKKTKKRNQFKYGIFILLLLFVFFCYLILVHSQIFASLFIFLYEVIKHQLPQYSPSYSIAKINDISTLINQSGGILLISVGALLVFIYWGTNKKLWLYILGIFLVMAELYLGVRGNLFFARVDKIQADQKVVDFLKTNLGDQRYISTADTQAYTGIWVYFNHLVTRPPFSQESVTDEELENWHSLKQELAMLPVDTNQFYNLKSAAGYVAILPKSYQVFAQSKDINSLKFGSWRNPILNDLAVKYIVSGVPDDVLAGNKSDQYTKAFQSGNMVIYENKQAKTRLSFITQGEEKLIELIQDNSEEIKAAVIADREGTLVLRDFWYPGWQVKVDGKAYPLNKYENIFRSVVIPSGTHQVVFSFKPRSLRVGALISGISWGLMVVVALKKERPVFSKVRTFLSDKNG